MKLMMLGSIESTTSWYKDGIWLNMIALYAAEHGRRWLLFGAWTTPRSFAGCCGSAGDTKAKIHVMHVDFPFVDHGDGKIRTAYDVKSQITLRSTKLHISNYIRLSGVSLSPLKFNFIRV